MSSESPKTNSFFEKLDAILIEHLANEQFGVSELAEEVGMSRSNLLRKIKKDTGLSASQYIRNARLKAGMELIRSQEFNVSEVGYKVGFSSTSYFIKCFREFYGYPPGEVGNHPIEAEEPIDSEKKQPNFPVLIIAGSLGLVVLLVVLLYHFVPRSSNVVLEKSIAVLPFKNDSNDSTNVYLINGVMESVLNNLQKIEDLRVISRTSVEKYRTLQKSIPEIGEELDVSYLIEGSGQKQGNKILLNIRLIEASGDQRIWSAQYSREVNDIFDLQQEIAKLIADNIEVVITPSAQEQIEKVLTENIAAYDHYLKAQEFMNQETREGLFEALKWLDLAIEEDPTFAAAYANRAFCYYYLDVYQRQKNYGVQLNENADKAILYDQKLAQSLIAKALTFFHSENYSEAVPFLEKALEFNPNSLVVIHLLSDFYARIQPNTSKYLEYALRGMQLDIAPSDSIMASYTYLHLSNALVQSGFVDLSLKYMDKSIAYFEENGYSKFVKAYIVLAKNKNLEQAKKSLLIEYQKDTTRLDILQEVAKIHYYMRDFEGAYHYYSKLEQRRQAGNLKIYSYEDSKLAYTCRKLGLTEDAKRHFQSYQDFAKSDQSIYEPLGRASIHAYLGENEKAIEAIEEFTSEKDFQYWVVLFMDKEPMYDNLLDDPEFKKAIKKIELNFWTHHQELKESLKEKGLL